MSLPTFLWTLVLNLLLLLIIIIIITIIIIIIESETFSQKTEP